MDTGDSSALPRRWIVDVPWKSRLAALGHMSDHVSVKMLRSGC